MVEKSKPRWKPNACKCIDILDKEVKKRHNELHFAFGFKGEMRLMVSAGKAFGAPLGTKAVNIVCSYCPMCGKKYPPFWGPKGKEPTKRDIKQARKFGAPKVNGKFV